MLCGEGGSKGERSEAVFEGAERDLVNDYPTYMFMTLALARFVLGGFE